MTGGIETAAAFAIAATLVAGLSPGSLAFPVAVGGASGVFVGALFASSVIWFLGKVSSKALGVGISVANTAAAVLLGWLFHDWYEHVYWA